jgi:hypothetical protein
VLIAMPSDRAERGASTYGVLRLERPEDFLVLA